MLIFPHAGGNEIISASGSVRRTIDHGKLMVTTNIPFFSEFTEDMCLKIPRDISHITFGRWLGRKLASSDSEEGMRLRGNLKDYAQETYWSKVARKHVDFYLESLS
jgi:hypothetical protein